MRREGQEGVVNGMTHGRDSIQQVNLGVSKTQKGRENWQVGIGEWGGSRVSKATGEEKRSHMRAVPSPSGARGLACRWARREADEGQVGIGAEGCGLVLLNIRQRQEWLEVCV